MKKLLILLLISIATGGAALVAQDASEAKTFSVDAGLGLSFGLFDSLKDSAFGDLSAFATIASIRGGGDLSLLYTINSVVSAGGSLGVHYLTFTPSGGNPYTFFDIPLRAVAKIGSNGAFIQPFLGYYWTAVGFPFPGLEAGARADLGGFYVEASYVLGQYKWTHIGFGLEFENIFKF